MNKCLKLIFCLLISSFLYSQSIVGSLNSSSISSELSPYSIGEIFVIPSDKNLTNSGTLGVVTNIIISANSQIKILENSNVTFYPNPVKNELTILANDLNENNISITSLDGKFYNSIVLIDNRLDVSFLLKGIYVIRIGSNRAFKIEKQ